MQEKNRSLKIIEDRVVDGSAADSIEVTQKSLEGLEEGLNPLLRQQILRRADKVLHLGQRSIYAADLKKRMDKGERLFLLDIRLAENFLTGHIPGSLNVEFYDALEPHNVAKLPTDGTPIIIICYTGHTASQLDSLLNLVGYNSWTLRFGMMGWNDRTRTSVWSSRDSQELCGGGFHITEDSSECRSNMDAHLVNM
jgi:rhodanese-related sulfurtransferase